MEQSESASPREQGTGLSRRTLLTAAGAAFFAVNVGASIFSAGPVSANSVQSSGLLAMSAWGGHSNGNIPLSQLSTIPWNTARRLRSDAANSLIALNQSFRAALGRDLPLSDAYRDYAGQVEARNYWCGQGNCGFAAVPGTSNHGWALAIDIGVGRTDWNNPIYIWMKANAAAFGWTHPLWAEPGGAHPEAWHWEYTGSYTTPQPEPEKPLIPTHQSTTFAWNSTLAANAWTPVRISANEVYIALVGNGHRETGEVVLNVRASGVASALQLRLVAESLTATGAVAHTFVQPAVEIPKTISADGLTHGQYVMPYFLIGPIRLFAHVRSIAGTAKIEEVTVKKNYWQS